MAASNNIKYQYGEISRFFAPLANRNLSTRCKELARIRETFDMWSHGYGSPKENFSHPDHNSVNGVCMGQKMLLQEHLPMTLHLAMQCPFDDVRDKCAAILDDLQIFDSGIKIPRPAIRGPSFFIPLSETTPVNTTDEKRQEIFIDTYLQNGRLDHIMQIVAFHPTYLEHFLQVQSFLFHGDGPLPYQHRHFIAIMAAARHQCSYLIEQQIAGFLISGGDQKWLGGLSYIPQKLRDLSELNRILAHQPWLINTGHIENLTNGQNKWTLAELLQAIVIMSTFHALSSFVLGSGINSELDHPCGHTLRPLSTHSDSNDSDSNTSITDGVNQHQDDDDDEPIGGINTLISRMKNLGQVTPTEEENILKFKDIDRQNTEIATTVKRCLKTDFVRFTDQPDFIYEDFAKRLDSYKIEVFRAQDYSWTDNGYALANRLYCGIGPLLNDKFSVAYNLTYSTMGDMTNIDTTYFRTAIWNYIHCLFGIRHDDYDYGQINRLLERNLKVYIKTVTCFPETVTKRHYDSVMQEFHHSEKIHVNLMMQEARLQAELLYALRCVMNYMTPSRPADKQ